MATPLNPTSRWYPSLPKELPIELREAIRLAFDNTYTLRDKSPSLVEVTVTADTIIDVVLTPPKPLRVVVVQDSVGGWNLTWASKFKGTNLITLDTTANTYSVFDFDVRAADKALLTNWVSGGTLS